MEFKFKLSGEPVNPQEVKDHIEGKFLSTLRIKEVISNFWDSLLLEFLEFPLDYSQEFIDDKEFNSILWDFIYKDFSTQEQIFLRNVNFSIDSYTLEEIEDAIRVSIDTLIDTYIKEHLKEDEDLSLRIMQLKMGVAN